MKKQSPTRYLARGLSIIPLLLGWSGGQALAAPPQPMQQTRPVANTPSEQPRPSVKDITDALKYGSLTVALEAARRGWSTKTATRSVSRQPQAEAAPSPEQLHRQQLQSLLNSLLNQHIQIKLKDGRAVRCTLLSAASESVLLERTVRIGGQRVQLQNRYGIQSIVAVEHSGN